MGKPKGQKVGFGQLSQVEPKTKTRDFPHLFHFEPYLVAGVRLDGGEDRQPGGGVGDVGKVHLPKTAMGSKRQAGVLEPEKTGRKVGLFWSTPGDFLRKE